MCIISGSNVVRNIRKNIISHDDLINFLSVMSCQSGSKEIIRRPQPEGAHGSHGSSLLPVTNNTPVGAAKDAWLNLPKVGNFRLFF